MDTENLDERELIYVNDSEVEPGQHSEYVQTSFGVYDPESEEGQIALQLIDAGIIEGKRKHKKVP